jgi:hypothetical protein
MQKVKSEETDKEKNQKTPGYRPEKTILKTDDATEQQGKKQFAMTCVCRAMLKSKIIAF